MNNQLFILDNFEQAWYWMERRGRSMYDIDPNVAQVIRKIKSLPAEKTKLILAARGQKGRISEISNEFKNRKSILREEKNKEIRKFLSTIESKFENQIKTDEWTWGLSSGIQIGEPGKEKRTYKLPDNDPLRLFISRQLEWNLKSTLAIAEKDRNSIIKEIQVSLECSIPTLIIRTDLSSFYENIDHEILINKLERSVNLSAMSLFLVKVLLKEFDAISGTPGLGVPRGVAISAKLAELYLSDMDETLKNLTGVYYYARFVDDIIILSSAHSPKFGSNVQQACKSLRSYTATNGVIINQEKTLVQNTRSGKYEFEFLGYCIKREPQKPLALLMSHKRYERYLKRTDLAFERYWVDPARPGSDFVLLSRIRFLTANLRLLGSKGNVIAGIYNSNKLLSDLSQLVSLDANLSQHVTRISNTRLRNQLKSLSFIDGFNLKRMVKMSQKTIENVGNAWR